MKIAIIAALLGLAMSTDSQAQTSTTVMFSEGSHTDAFEGAIVDSSSDILSGFSAQDAFGAETSGPPWAESLAGGHVIFVDAPTAFINFHTASAVTIEALNIFLMGDSIGQSYRGFSSVSLYASLDGGLTFGTLLAHAKYDPASGPVRVSSAFDAITAQFFRFEGVMPNAGARLLEIDAIAAVPEPATWAMMLVGFGGIGYTMRKRQASYSLSIR